RAVSMYVTFGSAKEAEKKTGIPGMVIMSGIVLLSISMKDIMSKIVIKL
ncbi:hypothetical protein LCGC14_3131270, partial [marine sediment metagenome]